MNKNQIKSLNYYLDLIKKNTAARRKAKLHEIAKAANVKLTKKTVESKAAKEPATKKKPAAKKTTKTKE